jgi:hypothetical protein
MLQHQRPAFVEEVGDAFHRVRPHHPDVLKLILIFGT